MNKTTNTAEMPTVDYTWIDMGNDWHYVMVNAENGDWLEELAVLRNEGGRPSRWRIPTMARRRS